MSRKKLTFDIAIFFSLLMLFGFLAVQAKELGILGNSGEVSQNTETISEDLSCVTSPTPHPISETATLDYTFLTNQDTECSDAAKKQPIGGEKIKKVRGDAINKCEDALFSLKQTFKCVSPCKSVLSNQKSCTITDGPRLTDARECGSFGGQKKCCATLTATASGGVTQACVGPETKGPGANNISP